MAKTTNLYVRLDPELKKQAENILDQLGIPVSNAVNIFLKQVVMQRGLPFDVKLPSQKPKGVASLSEAELDIELQKGFEDVISGNTKPAPQVFSEFRKDYGI